MDGEKLQDALVNSINNEVVEITENILEVGLDTLFENDICKDIPFVSTIVSLYRIGDTLIEKYNLKKYSMFINSFNKRVIATGDVNKYIDRLKKDKRKTKKELEYLIILINRYIEIEKSGLIACLYFSYLNCDITWEELCQYSSLLDKLLPGDLEELCKEALRIYPNIRFVPSEVQRLSSLGLMIEVHHGVEINEQAIVFDESEKSEYVVTSFGKKLIDCLKTY